MDETAAELIAERLRVLGQPLRIRLLARLQQGPASVNELTESIAAVQQNVSQHLAVMHKAGIVERCKSGAHVFYELADGHSVAIIEATRAALAQRSHQLARLSAALSDDATTSP
jgi:DNA-binding transcriptional ArsR family regulator